MSDTEREPQVPDVPTAMPGENDESTVAGAAPDGSAIGRPEDASEPGSADASASAGDSVGGDTLGGTRSGSEDPATKDPSEWVTGDESMTAPQRSYLDTLAREAGEELPADLTKAQASEQIDRLQAKTGRGQSH